VQGKATVGSLEQSSSKNLKENITELPSEEVTELLKGLKPVKYSFKGSQSDELHLGFISEEVPDLVASADKSAISPMDIIAILTKAVQDQQQSIKRLTSYVQSQEQEIEKLIAKVYELEEKNQPRAWFR